MAKEQDAEPAEDINSLKQQARIEQEKINKLSDQMEGLASSRSICIKKLRAITGKIVTLQMRENQ